jgi:hypothetical protein
MNPNEASNNIIGIALMSPSGERYLGDAYAYLQRLLSRGGFNRIRAIEVLTIAIDNSVWADLKGSPMNRQIYADYKASKLGPSTALRLADQFIADHKAVDQRAPRKWFRPLLGA